jgi:hypothetical protein
MELLIEAYGPETGFYYLLKIDRSTKYQPHGVNRGFRCDARHNGNNFTGWQGGMAGNGSLVFTQIIKNEKEWETLRGARSLMPRVD